MAEDETSWPSWATERVRIVDYDPGWARFGAAECIELQRVLQPWRVGDVEHGGDRWHQQLAFRDALRADPELVRAYARLKAELAERHRGDRESYSEGKRQFVDDVIRGAVR